MTTAVDTSSTAPGTRPLALVTGASSGIGLELARQFAEHDFDVVIAAEDDELDDAAQSLAAAGTEVHPIRVDLATPDGVEALYDAVEALGRPVDAAALNAGVGVGGRFDQTELQRDLRVVALNVASQVHLAKLLVRPMVQRGEGRLLFTSSIAAQGPGPFHATYAASKAFLHSFAEAIRTELKDTGVTVTSLMPGPTDTEFFDRADLDDSRIGSSKHKDDPADVAKDGFQALMAGKDSVVGGSFRNKVQAATSKMSPAKAASRGMAQMTKPRADAD